MDQIVGLSLIDTHSILYYYLAVLSNVYAGGTH
jgi:hypothetical protein